MSVGAPSLILRCMAIRNPLGGNQIDTAVASGQTALDSGRYEEAADYFRSALRMAPRSLEEEALIRCRLSEALEKRSLNREQLEVVARFEEGPQLDRLSDQTRVRVLVRLAWGYSFTNDIPRAIALFNQAMRIARRLEDHAGMGACYVGLGRAYRVVSELRIARDHYSSALEHYRIVGNWRELAESYVNIAYVNAREGEYQSALNSINQALTIIGNREEHELLGRAYMYTGITYDHLEATAKAIESFEKSLYHFRNAGNDLYLAIVQNNFAEALMWRGDWARAEQMLKAAIVVLEKSSGVAVIGAAYDTLAQLYLRKGELDEAERMTGRSVEVLSSIKSSKWTESIVHTTIGRIQLLRGQPETAFNSFQLAIEMGEKIGDQQHLVPFARLWLAQSLIALGKNEEARAAVESVRSYLLKFPNLKIWGFLMRTIAGIEAASGNIAPAIQSLGQSSSIYEVRGYAYDRAVNRVAHARLLNRQGRAAQAIREVETALTEFTEIGAALDERDALVLLEELRNEGGGGRIQGALAELAAPVLEPAVDAFIARRMAQAAVSRELVLHELAAITRDLVSARGVVVAEAAGERLRLVVSLGLSSGEEAGELGLLNDAPANELHKEMVYPFSDNQQTHFLLHVIEPAGSWRDDIDSSIRALINLAEQGLELQLLRSKTRKTQVFNPARLLAEVELPGFICASRAMSRVLEQIHKISSSDVTVLITGESGTGKELIARAIHASSSRRFNTFLPFNCSSSPRDMIESQLFGYRRGAFTGAVFNNEGIIRTAERGTLFLDEMGDLPLDLQPKLLRFLQEGEILPIGENQPLHVDVRVIAATNADLERAVAEGKFREDLFHRLNVIRIQVPPLRERREEIPPLINHYLHLYQREMAKTNIRVAEEAVDLMVVYDWPGNVRQLCNELRRMVAYSDSDTIVGVESLSPEIVRISRELRSATEPPRRTVEISGDSYADVRLSDAVNELERRMIQDALRRSSGNVAQAAKELGLSRKGLYLKMDRLKFRI